MRAVLDYVRLALRGKGRITLADGPMLSSDFVAIRDRTGIDRLRDVCASGPFGVGLEVLDLRSTFLETRNDVIVRRHPLTGDPAGAVVVDLAKASLFYSFAGEGRYYGADYDTDEVNAHHRGEVQQYKLSATAMSADVIIDVPKLKAHSKAGVTMALKGIVGLNSGRNWLPHRTQGTPEQGGDQFAESSWHQRLELALVRAFEQASLRHPHVIPALYGIAKVIGKRVFGATNATIRGGAWWGNETIWRMALDINRALMYADSKGRLHDTPVRRRFCLVDGIVAGEGEGPIYAEPKPCGVVLAGRNPVAVDVVGAELMGFSHSRIPMLVNALSLRDLPLASFGADDIEVASNVPEWQGRLSSLRLADPYRFAAPRGWRGSIERGPLATADPTTIRTEDRPLTRPPHRIR